MRSTLQQLNLCCVNYCCSTLSHQSYSKMFGHPILVTVIFGRPCESPLQKQLDISAEPYNQGGAYPSILGRRTRYPRQVTSSLQG